MIDFKVEVSGLSKAILVVGSANMDLVIKAKSIPKPGETITDGDFYTSCGGKGANQAVTVARLGGRCYFVGRVGKDTFGKELRESLIRNNVNIDYLVEDKDNPTGVAFIMVNSDGENCIIVAPGANRFLTQEDIERSLTIMPSIGVLLTQLEIPIETTGFALKLAKEHGITTILNPAPAREIDPDIFSLVDIVTPNESELKILTGIEPREKKDIVMGGKKLLDYGAKTVIVTLGGKGAMIIEKDLELYIPPVKVSVVDTTGAGDVFNGALAVRVTCQDPIEKAVRYAVISAGISVTRRGAQSSIPTAEEVDQFTRKGMIEV